ncbi:hypothetical protein [Salmonirosea aquatica]|uniref:Uncharacterized protein n=1 Tax=Salmonirosea aquatica TaxID=2654236 RepID=A0A7C9BG25_9BACT|nr:hypothetical protein [Cytophagaceae bacterium SJW1-29]
MLKPVRYTSDDDTLVSLNLIVGGMLFEWDEGGDICCCICERTIRDYGLSVEQFKHMVLIDGLRQMLEYYPNAFLHLGHNKYIHCEILAAKPKN